MYSSIQRCLLYLWGWASEVLIAEDYFINRLAYVYIVVLYASLVLWGLVVGHEVDDQKVLCNLKAVGEAWRNSERMATALTQTDLVYNRINYSPFGGNGVFSAL